MHHRDQTYTVRRQEEYFTAKKSIESTSDSGSSCSFFGSVISPPGGDPAGLGTPLLLKDILI